MNLPLVEDCQSLTVVSGVDEPDAIARMVKCSDTVAILKTYKDYDAILDAVGPMGNGRRAFTVSLCGLEQEALAVDPESLRGRPMPYLSLMIVKNTKRD